MPEPPVELTPVLEAPPPPPPEFAVPFEPFTDPVFPPLPPPPEPPVAEVPVLAPEAPPPALKVVVAA